MKNILRAPGNDNFVDVLYNRYVNAYPAAYKVKYTKYL